MCSDDFTVVWICGSLRTNDVRLSIHSLDTEYHLVEVVVQAFAHFYWAVYFSLLMCNSLLSVMCIAHVLSQSVVSLLSFLMMTIDE